MYSLGDVNRVDECLNDHELLQVVTLTLHGDQVADEPGYVDLSYLCQTDEAPNLGVLQHRVERLIRYVTHLHQLSLLLNVLAALLLPDRALLLTVLFAGCNDL